MRVVKAESKTLRLFSRYFLPVISVLTFHLTVGHLPALAQDSGEPDSVKLVLNPASLIGTNLMIVVECSVFVDVDSNQVLQFAWKWDNASLQIDSAKAAPRFDSMDIGPFFYLGDDRNTTNDSQVAICSGVCSFNCYPPAPGWRHLATYYMHSPSWTAGSSVNIDTVQLSGFYAPSTEYIFLPVGGTPYDPVWGGPISFAGCCVGIRGDVNLDGSNADALDLNYMVNYIFRNGPVSPCPQEADVNSDGNSGNIVDLNYLVTYIFRTGPAPGACG